MGRAMLSKSLIQFLVDGLGCVPSLLLDLRPNYGGGNEDNSDLPQKVQCTLLHLMPLTLQQATANPSLHWRLLDPNRQVWVSLFCFFLIGPGMQNVLFVPSKSLFPQSCVSSGKSMVGQWRPLPRVLMPYPGLLHQNPAPATGHCWPIPPQETLKYSKACLTQSVGSPRAHKVLFEPSEHLWQVWVLILNAISPLLPSFWGFSFVLGMAYLFLVGSTFSWWRLFSNEL